MLNSISAAAQQQYPKTAVEACIAPAPVSDMARQLSRLEAAAACLEHSVASLVQRLDVVLIPEGPTAAGLGCDVNAKTDGPANTHLAQQLYSVTAHLSAIQRRVDGVVSRLGI